MNCRCKLSSFLWSYLHCPCCHQGWLSFSFIEWKQAETCVFLAGSPGKYKGNKTPQKRKLRHTPLFSIDRLHCIKKGRRPLSPPLGTLLILVFCYFQVKVDELLSSDNSQHLKQLYIFLMQRPFNVFCFCKH